MDHLHPSTWRSHQGIKATIFRANLKSITGKRLAGGSGEKVSHVNEVPAMRDALSSETGRVEFEILGKGRAVRN
jgi:hypothetical protein